MVSAADSSTSDSLPQDYLLNLLQQPASLITDWQEWSQRLQAHAETDNGSVLVAAAIGAQSAVPSYAFAAGYQCALCSMIPSLDITQRYAFCVTEEAGNSAKVIETSLQAKDDHFLLSGHKKFITGADQATQLLIVANSGVGEDGRKKLKLVNVEKSSGGIELEIMQGLPFIPELSHGRLTFDNLVVQPEQILAGDAYEEYVKPFRTVEDIHVYASVLGYLVGIAKRNDWPQEILEKLLGLLIGFQAVANTHPKLSGGHIALGGLFTLAKQLIDEIQPLIEQLPEELKTIWERDKVLLTVALKAREKRLENAWLKV